MQEPVEEIQSPTTHPTGGDTSLDGRIDSDERRSIAVDRRPTAEETELAKTSMELAINEKKALFSSKQNILTGKLKVAVNSLIVWGLKAVGVMGMALLLVRALHLVLPPRWLWLFEYQIETIDHLVTVLAAGAAGTFLSGYFKKAFKIDPSKNDDHEPDS